MQSDVMETEPVLMANWSKLGCERCRGELGKHLDAESADVFERVAECGPCDAAGKEDSNDVQQVGIPNQLPDVNVLSVVPLALVFDFDDGDGVG